MQWPRIYSSMEATDSIVHRTTLLISSTWRECQPTRMSWGWLLFRCCCLFVFVFQRKYLCSFFVVFCLLLFQNAPFTELSMTAVGTPWCASFSRAYETCSVEAADQTTHLPQSTIENVSETSVLLFPISDAWAPSLGWEKDEETTPEHQHPGLTLITSPRHDLNISVLGWL